jgi:hypothetical protein
MFAQLVWGRKRAETAQWALWIVTVRDRPDGVEVYVRNGQSSYAPVVFFATGGAAVGGGSSLIHDLRKPFDVVLEFPCVPTGVASAAFLALGGEAGRHPDAS